MTRTLVSLAMLCGLATLAPSPARAHPGHDHTVMGTVKSLKDGHLEVEAKDGKVTTFMLSETTKILRAKTKVSSSDIKVGERVVAIGTTPQGGAAAGHASGAHAPAGMLVAKEIRLGAAPKAPATQ